MWPSTNKSYLVLIIQMSVQRLGFLMYLEMTEGKNPMIRAFCCSMVNVTTLNWYVTAVYQTLKYKMRIEPEQMMGHAPYLCSVMHGSSHLVMSEMWVDASWSTCYQSHLCFQEYRIWVLKWVSGLPYFVIHFNENTCSNPTHYLLWWTYLYALPFIVYLFHLTGKNGHLWEICWKKMPWWNLWCC